MYICIYAYICVCAKDGGLQWSIDDKMFRQNARPMTVHRQVHGNSDDCTTQKRCLHVSYDYAPTTCQLFYDSYVSYFTIVITIPLQLC